MRPLVPLLVLAALGWACGGDRSAIVPELEQRITHLENAAELAQASHERQIAALEVDLDALRQENASLRESLETYRTVTGSDRGLERHAQLLDQRLGACQATLDDYQKRLEGAESPVDTPSPTTP